jgi:hypothetical protein
MSSISAGLGGEGEGSCRPLLLDLLLRSCFVARCRSWRGVDVKHLALAYPGGMESGCGGDAPLCRVLR